MKLAALLCCLLALGWACRSQGDRESHAPPADSGRVAAPTATPVRVAAVRRATLDLIVTAPGHTQALLQDRLRAPFASRLVALHATDGDAVAAHEVVVEVVSKNSEAAMRGAEEMLRAASTSQDSVDARRAIEVARGNLVRQQLRAPADGVVLSHGAGEGDYLDEGEVVVTVAEAGSVFFDAEVTQSDLSRIRPGQPASIDLPAAGPVPVAAVVHGILPTASTQTLSAPVRLDFSARRRELRLGLFGTATIIVGRQHDAIIVPAAAVLRDDISGESRLAVVDSTNRARWLVVQTGVRQGDRVQVLSPPLTPGQRAIVDGQVGLPEGTPVQVEP